MEKDSVLSEFKPKQSPKMCLNGQQSMDLDLAPTQIALKSILIYLLGKPTYLFQRIKQYSSVFKVKTRW
jgi:hypothetical protein